MKEEVKKKIRSLITCSKNGSEFDRYFKYTSTLSEEWNYMQKDVKLLNNFVEIINVSESKKGNSYLKKIIYFKKWKLK